MATYTEVDVPKITLMLMPPHEWIKTYIKDDISVFVSLEDEGHHLSISHKHRLPTKAEVMDARNTLIPNGVKMHVPPEIINNSTTEGVRCVHLWEDK